MQKTHLKILSSIVSVSMLCTLNAGAFDIAPRMTYRTNEVEFTSASDITI